MSKKNTVLINRLFITGEEMSKAILIKRIKNRFVFKRIQLGKRKTNGYSHFYLFVDDYNNKEWKIKLTVQSLDKPLTMTAKTLFDFKHQYDQTVLINAIILVETYAPYTHNEWMYQPQNGAINFQTTLYESIIALFSTALTDNGDTYRNGILVELPK